MNGIPVSSSIAYSYIPVNGDVVAVTFASSAACALPAIVNNSATITVLAKQMPAVTVSADRGTEVCQGTAVTFTATPSNGGASPAYSWMKGGVLMSIGASYSYIPANGDVITCKTVSSYQCPLSGTATSEPVSMTVDVPATPMVSINAYPGLNIASGQSVSLDAFITNNIPSPVYQWKVNGNIVTAATTPAFVSNSFANNDIVTCTVTSGGGCAVRTRSAVVTLTVANVSVANINNAVHDFKLLPNPNNGNFTIKGNAGTADEDVTVEVTDMLAQVVYYNTVKTLAGEINEQVQLNSSVANGMYLLNMHTASRNNVFHIVVSR